MKHTQSMLSTDFDYALMAEYYCQQFETTASGKKLKKGEKPFHYLLCDFTNVFAPSKEVLFCTETIEEMAMKLQIAGIDVSKILYDDGICLADEDIEKFRALVSC